MFADNGQPHSSASDTPESAHRVGIMLAELWHEWFGAMSQVAYQTHRACEFMAANGGPPIGGVGPFDFLSGRSPFEGHRGPVDMEKLKECLRPLEPTQAARVIHAVQMMQAMEVMLSKRRSRAEQEGAAW
jgi:hypothetical protein